jgi:DNA-binding response OmpR family regulator/HPt (histidine-containing phosphotransfer) domain-containing protein
MKILVVEDDVLVADALRSILSRHNYAVEIAHDGRAGLDCIEAFNYDLLLLDIILPKLDGISLCRHVRSRGDLMPILLLTSKDSKHDRATGLDAGADDYVVKPFNPEELSARIRALLRRGNDNSQPILTWKGLTLNPRNYEVTYEHQLLTLTPKEYALLELFLRHNQRLFSCGAILEHLWTYEDTPSEEAVRTHIKGLRHKLKAVGAPHNLVETVYGIGYRLKTNHLTTTSELGDVAIHQDSDLVVARSSPPTPALVAQSDTPQLLAAIWDRYYDQTIDRVEMIDRAITALKAGSLSPEVRLQACQSAHTLAGTLGTFGLPLGSQAAKQIELLLDAANLDLTPAEIPQLQNRVDDLRREIASKVKVAEVEPKVAAPERDRLSFRIATGEAFAKANASAQAEAPLSTSPPTPTRSVCLSSEAPPTTQLLIVTKDPDLAPAVHDATTGNFETIAATELTSTQLAQTPDLIILDLDCFPQDTDGLTVLSDLDRDYPALPVLVLSQPISHADIVAESADPTRRLQQRIEVARRGGRMFLSKPISARQILLAVDRVLQQAHVHQASILIVDDDLLLLAGMTALLSPAGMTVTTLSEPNRFWETLEACSPDLLILDLDMPIYNGIELCRAVRTDPRWATLPIMFLTAHPAALAIDRVFAAGADDFVPKPAIASALVARILNRLERIGLQRSTINDQASPN